MKRYNAPVVIFLNKRLFMKYNTKVNTMNITLIGLFLILNIIFFILNHAHGNISTIENNIDSAYINCFIKQNIE